MIENLQLVVLNFLLDSVTISLFIICLFFPTDSNQFSEIYGRFIFFMLL